MAIVFTKAVSIGKQGLSPVDTGKLEIQMDPRLGIQQLE